MEEKLRILLIEDVQTDAELEIRELRRAGLRVEHRIVETEEAYRAALREFNPDLIISDFSMPQFDGMFALTIARELAPDVPFIFVSGTIGEEYAIRALKNGATDYVLKDNLVRLPAAVERAVRGAHDLSERRRAEARLHLQGTALDAAANAIMITRRDGTIRWVNRAFSTLTGYSAEEAIGKNPRMLKSGQHGLEFYRRMIETILGGSMWQGEIVNRYKDGRLATEEMTITPVRDQGGEITDFIAIKQDITARKAAEKHRARLSAILEASPDFVATADPDRKMLYLNRAARRLLELPEDVDASQVRIGDTHPPWAAELVFKTGIPTAIRDGVWSGETAFLTPGGREVPVIQVILAHKGPDGSVEFLSTIAHDITARKQADERIRRLNRVYAVLSGINSTIVRVRDREELFSEACRIAVEAGNFRAAWLGIVDRKTDTVQPVAWHGLDSEYIQAMPLAVVQRKPQIVADMATDPRIKLKKESLERGFRSLAVLPLLVAGEGVGVLALYAGEIGFFDDEEEMKLLNELGGDISFAIDHIEKANKLDYLAFYDQLTGLANRALFLERVNQSIHATRQAEGKFALAILDIERLRTINESLGRQAGDALIGLVAQRLRTAGGSARVGRISADYFALVLGEIKGRSQAVRVVGDALRKCFGESFDVSGTELRLSAKAGVALYPGDGVDAETLLRNAEAALRKAKGLGERHVFYTAALTERTVGQLTLENQLRQALEKEQFVLHYQPKVDLENRAIVGVEALIRWQSPELGLVPPGKFIPLMEETGLILEAGAWALKQAALDHRKWFELGLKAPRVAVNVSSIQLRQRDFVANVEQAIIEGIAPTGIDLEITESLIMEDVQGSIEKLKAVRGLGVRIAIDDFGTGYSSLGYLAKLPVQTLKIDRSFIITMLADPDIMTLVQTVISLAHSLKLTVVAEGVEEEEQAKMLRLLRCDEMQGYLFSKPIPFEAMTALLRQEKKA